MQKNIEVCEKRTCRKCHVYRTDLRFPVFLIAFLNANWGSKSEICWGSGSTFGWPKGGQNYDFLERCELRFGVLKTMVCGMLGVRWGSKMRSNKYANLTNRLNRLSSIWSNSILSSVSLNTLVLDSPFVSPSSLKALLTNPCFNPQFQQALIVRTNIALLVGLLSSGLPDK